LCGEDAVLQAEQSQHIPTIAYAHLWNCIFEMMRRDPARAGPHADAFVALGREHDLPAWLAVSAVVQRWASWVAGEQGAGASGIRESNSALLKMGFRLCAPLFAACVAEAEASERRIEAAVATLDDQLAETKRSGQRWYDAELHRLRGELLFQREPPDGLAAEAALISAIETARRQHARSFELRAALSLAKVYQATGRVQAARDLLAPAAAGLSKGPELPEVAEAHHLLASLEAGDVGASACACTGETVAGQ
jgi:predicted ATPase